MSQKHEYFQYLPATTTLILPFSLESRIAEGSHDESRANGTPVHTIRSPFHAAHKVEHYTIWQPLQFDNDLKGNAVRDEVKYLWGLVEGQDERAQYYFGYEVPQDTLTWLFEGMPDYGIMIKKNNKSKKAKTNIIAHWKPLKINAFITRESVGVLSITGQWSTLDEINQPSFLLVLADSIDMLRNIDRTLRLNDDTHYNLASFCKALITSQNLKKVDFYKKDKVDTSIFRNKNPYLFNTVYLSAQPSSDEELHINSWRLRRGYSRTHVPPLSEHDQDLSLRPRENRHLSIAYEGLLLCCWPQPNSTEHDLPYPRKFSNRHFLLYIQCILESEVINALNQQALKQLRERPKSEDKTSQSWRKNLKLLVDKMVDYSLAVNIPVSSNRSDYQSLYLMIRKALYIDQLREDLESGIRLLYEVYETELRQVEERREQAHRQREERYDRNIQIIALPMSFIVILSGILGMNNFDSTLIQESKDGFLSKLFFQFSLEIFLRLFVIIVSIVLILFIINWIRRPKLGSDK